MPVEGALSPNNGRGSYDDEARQGCCGDTLSLARPLGGILFLPGRQLRSGRSRHRHACAPQGPPCPSRDRGALVLRHHGGGNLRLRPLWSHRRELRKALRLDSVAPVAGCRHGPRPFHLHVVASALREALRGHCHRGSLGAPARLSLPSTGPGKTGAEHLPLFTAASPWGQCSPPWPGGWS